MNKQNRPTIPENLRSPESEASSESRSKKLSERAPKAGSNLWSLFATTLLGLSIVSLVIYLIRQRRPFRNQPKTAKSTPASDALANTSSQSESLILDRSLNSLQSSTTDSTGILSEGKRLGAGSSSAKTVFVPDRPSINYLTFIILLITLTLLFITQYIFNFAYWFNLDLTPLAFLNPLACFFPDFCNVLRFPPYGFIALLTALLAALLFGGWLALQKLPTPISEPAFVLAQKPNRTRLTFQIDGTMFIAFGLCQAYVIFQAIKDQPVLPIVWVLGLLILLLIGWRLDRSQLDASPLQLLSPTLLNVLYIVGIAALLFATAALHAQRWLWVFVFGSTTFLLWLRVWLSSWQSWDKASRIERLILPLITLGSFLLFSNGLNSWRWSFLGDEYSFYDLAQEFATGIINQPLLSSAGVYGVHPVLSSAWQGATMWLFGNDGYGWRVSHSLLLAISIPFFYYFLRPIIGRTGSFFAVAVYGSAHVLLTLGHVGSNNVQVIFAMATSLAALVWAGRRGSWAGFVLVGICLGLGFYMFAVARIYSLIIAIWLAIYYFPINFRARKFIGTNMAIWFTVVGSTLLTSLPVLSTRSAWGVLARQTVLTSEVAFTPYAQLIQFLQNTLYGFTAFLFNNQNAIWIFGAHADPITSTLMVIGLAALLLPNKQTWRVRISLLTSYIMFVIIIAGTQQYGYPSVSRIFTFVPFYAIFAAIGLLAIRNSFRIPQTNNVIPRIPNAILTGSVVLMAALIVPLNSWQSNVLSQQRSHQQGPAFLLQTAQMSADKSGAGPHLFYVGDPQYEDWAKKIFSVHDIPLDRLTFVLPRDTLLSTNPICKSADQPAIAMITTEIANAGYIAGQLHQCWPGSELRLIKDVLNSAIQYRIVNKGALPFIHSAGGYWLEEHIPETTLTKPSDDRFAWTAYQPSGISQNSKGQLAVVEAVTNQVIFLDSNGQTKNILGNVFVYAADVSYLPDDSFVVADAGQGLLWFDAKGQFRFKSTGGDSPRGVFAASDGTVYVASAGSRAITQVKTNGEVLRTIKGPQFGQPTSVAVAADGRIAVGDPVIGKVTINSNKGDLLAEYPIGLGDTGINKPGLLWLQDGGFIYTDPVNNNMVWLDPNGKIVKQWNHLKTPTDLVLQSTGILLVLEGSDNHISSIPLK